MPQTLSDGARDVLLTADPAGKVAKTHAHVRAWRAGTMATVGTAELPDIPARPGRPELRAPAMMAKRGVGGHGDQIGRKIALLHALAHIELNAIDLAWDAAGRFGGDPRLPRGYADDWVGVADEEARHFQMLVDRLADFDAAYGDLPAHNSLWEAAQKTAHDPLAQMACLPMLFEARGLDVTPGTVKRLRRHDDEKTAAILEEIAADEIGHVAAGTRWFKHLARSAGLEPRETYKDLVLTHIGPILKGPFNTEARDQAGLSAAYYDRPELRPT